MENRQFGFEKLSVWIKAKQVTLLVYECTKHFPNNEKFGLVSQMRRSAVSVCSNIAEGSGRSSKKDNQHFLTIAYSSLMELINQLIIAYETGLTSEEKYLVLRREIQITGFLIHKLHQSLNN
ncbi:MAG: four helix bundle protein [Saprospiraceae bacterium]|nr:four helix bundle protein [Saprospiraceae bacterium]